MYFCFIYVLALNLGAGQGVMTEAEKEDFLYWHNDYRWQAWAADMYELKWNDELEAVAQQLANRCHFEHAHNGRVGDFESVGENILWWPGEKTPEFVVDRWHAEIDDYDYASNTCAEGEYCTHYTQVTWADTKAVGCASNKCPRMTFPNREPATDVSFYVCNYGPKGNMHGQRPFQTGGACTKCSSGKFWCRWSYCDDSCDSTDAECECNAACQNGGKVVESTCTCECVNGFTGVDCSVCPVCEDQWNNCADHPDRCKHDYWVEKCPVTCKTCPDPPAGCP